MEAYLMFCYVIKIKDVSLGKDTMHKITIILQAHLPKNISMLKKYSARYIFLIQI